MKVSIIVPVYNVEQYLEKCLISLVNQTLDNIEIIVVNDGSPDNSQKIIDKYYKKYPNKIKKHIKENGGLSSARNYGLKFATGEFVAFVDSDDYVDVNMYKIMYDKAKKNNSDIVCCNLNVVIGDRIEKKKINDTTNNNMYNRFLFSSICACDKLIKKEIIEKNNWHFPEKIWYEDFASIPLLSLYTNKISYVDDYLYYYLTREGSIMNQAIYNDKLEDIFKAYEQLKLGYNKYKNGEKNKDEFEYLYIKHLLHDASLRFLKFKNKKAKINLKKIASIMHKDYPNWKHNKYLFLMPKKEIFLTKIIYYRLYWIYNIYRKVHKS